LVFFSWNHLVTFYPDCSKCFFGYKIYVVIENDGLDARLNIPELFHLTFGLDPSTGFRNRVEDDGEQKVEKDRGHKEEEREKVDSG